MPATVAASEAVDRSAFAMTEDLVTALKAKVQGSKVVFEQAEAIFRKAELAHAKTFTPVVLCLLAEVGHITRSSVFAKLTACGIPASLGLADNIITAHVLDSVLFEYRASDNNDDAVFKANGRYAFLAPA